MSFQILLVDDNDELRKIFRILLNEFDVIEASNGIEAQHPLRKNKPTLILMDILMPEMDGIEATKKILELDPGAQILAITAYSTRVKEMIEAGAVDILKKPIRKNDLIKKVKEFSDDL